MLEPGKGLVGAGGGGAVALLCRAGLLFARTYWFPASVFNRPCAATLPSCELCVQSHSGQEPPAVTHCSCSAG